MPFIRFLFAINLTIALIIILLLVIDKLIEARKYASTATIRLRYKWIGTDYYGVNLLKVGNLTERLIDEYYDTKVLEQICHFEDAVKTIVELINTYKLDQFKDTSSQVQSYIDEFANNIDQFNNWLQQPNVAAKSSFFEACKELKYTNQPILNRLGRLKDSILNYIEDNNLKVIDF